MKLLVVDDDRLFATLVQRGLREEGYAVDVAPSGNEGGCWRMSTVTTGSSWMWRFPT